MFVRHLNSHGLGVPLLASFSNGIVSSMIPGVSMEDVIFAHEQQTTVGLTHETVYRY